MSKTNWFLNAGLGIVILLVVGALTVFSATRNVITIVTASLVVIYTAMVVWSTTTGKVTATRAHIGFHIGIPIVLMVTHLILSGFQGFDFDISSLDQDATVALGAGMVTLVWLAFVSVPWLWEQARQDSGN